MSNLTNNSVDMDVSSTTYIGISHTIRFWYFLIFDILSIGCTLPTLYVLLFDRTLRHALHNHIFIVLLFIGLIYELINIPWLIQNNMYGTPWQVSSSFNLFWVFIDYPIYSLQIGLFSWATIERHILIFHDQWVSTRRKRMLIHYFPIVCIIIYYLIYYSIVYYGVPCQNSFDDFLTGGIYTPCTFAQTFLGTWDLFGHQIVPTLVIVICCIFLLLRILKQHARMNRTNRWKKCRKMTIQLLIISIIYLVFHSPWVIVLFSFKIGLLSITILNKAIIYTKFLFYNITFLFPYVCCLSLAEIRKKFKEKIFFLKRQRRIGATLTRQ